MNGVRVTSCGLRVRSPSPVRRLPSKIGSELDELEYGFFEVAFHRDAALGGACYAGNALCAKFVEQDVGKGHFSHEVYRGCRIIVLLHHAQNIVDCPDCHDFYLGSSGSGRYIREGHVHDLAVGFCGFALGSLPTGVWVVADVDEHI